MTSQSIVRRGVLTDYDEIMRLITLAHEEVHQDFFGFSVRRADYHLKRFLNPETIDKTDAGVRGLVGVIGLQGEKLEGCLVLALGQPWYSDDWSVEEYVNFVDPECRQSSHAKALIEYGKHIIDENIPHYSKLRMVIGIISLKRTAAKIRLYSQVLQPVGAFFSYPPIQDTTIEPLKRLYKGH